MGTKLHHVSMAHCQINDRGMKLIEKQLSVFDEQPIYTLNLASNYISDEGAHAAANILRINRMLMSLNLADNWIADEGCIYLSSVLGKFALEHDEIVVRRLRIMDYLIKKEKMV